MRIEALRLSLGLCALVLGACSASSADDTIAAAPAKRVLETPELMVHVVEPAARGFWRGYSEVLDENGWRDISPSSEADWKRVEDGAATLMVGGHLLLQPEYAREPVADWNRLTQQFLDLATEGKAQAENQSKDAMLVIGEQLDETCDSCHAQFAPHVN
ncbi:MAG: hypothetical protein EON61_11870 [Alphaproteobacteria bacterium]|nr:MAG: hypothetical protein EON61_11870 [Alphaproteobacteria bacterium]